MIEHQKLTEQMRQELLSTLQQRFEKHMYRHESVVWEDIEKKLKSNEALLETLYLMEITGGEPDVIQLDLSRDEIIYCDCSKETPVQRRNICYDHKALLARKKFPPEDSAMNMAETMGINMLTVDMYHQLQNIEPFDLKTSSWLLTPQKIRGLGGALFGDRRYDTVFIYHNGADSYYGVRSFRGYVKIK